jgi:hypothetical protein
LPTPSGQASLELDAPAPDPPAAPAPELLVVRLAIELEAAPTLATTLAMLGYRDQAGAIRQALERHGGRP